MCFPPIILSEQEFNVVQSEYGGPGFLMAWFCIEVEFGQWEEYFGTAAAAFPSEYSGRDSVSVPCLDTMLQVAAAASSLTALDVDWVGAEGAAALFLWDTEIRRTLGY